LSSSRGAFDHDGREVFSYTNTETVTHPGSRGLTHTQRDSRSLPDAIAHRRISHSNHRT